MDRFSVVIERHWSVSVGQFLPRGLIEPVDFDWKQARLVNSTILPTIMPGFPGFLDDHEEILCFVLRDN